MRPAGAQPLDHFQQVGEGPSEAADPVEAMRELHAAAATAGGALLEDRASASRPEHVQLWVGLLLFGRDPGVADQRHGPDLVRPAAPCPLLEVVNKRPFANLSRAREGVLEAAMAPIFHPITGL